MFDPSFGELLLRLALLAVVLNVVVFAPLAFAASVILERRNLPAIILGVLMGPVGLILIGFLEPRHATQCPYCYGVIRWSGATRCPHCTSHLSDDPLAGISR